RRELGPGLRARFAYRRHRMGIAPELARWLLLRDPGRRVRRFLALRRRSLSAIARTAMSAGCSDALSVVRFPVALGVLPTHVAPLLLAQKVLVPLDLPELLGTAHEISLVPSSLCCHLDAGLGGEAPDTATSGGLPEHRAVVPYSVAPGNSLPYSFRSRRTALSLHHSPEDFERPSLFGTGAPPVTASSSPT